MGRAKLAGELPEAVQNLPLIRQARFDLWAIGRHRDLKTDRIVTEDVHLIQHRRWILGHEDDRVDLTGRTIHAQHLPGRERIADIDEAGLESIHKPVTVKCAQIGALGTT